MRTASDERCPGHSLYLFALCNTTFSLSWSLNLNGKLFGYVSHRELCQDYKLVQSLSLMLGKLNLHHILEAVFFPLHPVRHHQIIVLFARSFSAQRSHALELCKDQRSGQNTEICARAKAWSSLLLLITHIVVLCWKSWTWKN